MTNKKVIKTIEYMDVEGVRNGSYDLGMTINGVDLVDMDLDKGLKILEDNNLIKDGIIIIPEGLELTKITQYGGAMEYNFGNGFIVADFVFDDDEETYIG